jgi:hypothetical protein
MIKVARFVDLVLAGLLAGNEFGTKVAIHPSLVWCPELQRWPPAPPAPRGVMMSGASLSTSSSRISGSKGI